MWKRKYCRKLFLPQSYKVYMYRKYTIDYDHDHIRVEINNKEISKIVPIFILFKIQNLKFKFKFVQPWFFVMELR